MGIKSVKKRTDKEKNQISKIDYPPEGIKKSIHKIISTYHKDYLFIIDEDVSNVTHEGLLH